MSRNGRSDIHLNLFEDNGSHERFILGLRKEAEERPHLIIVNMDEYALNDEDFEPIWSELSQHYALTYTPHRKFRALKERLDLMLDQAICVALSIGIEEGLNS